MLLSQDEARFPLVPMLRATLGVKGHRPMVGTWDNKDQVYCFAALNVVSGRLTTRLLEQPARHQARAGQSKAMRLQVAFAVHLQDSARAYPAHCYRDVIIMVDNASWHGEASIRQVLEAYPHLRLKRLPSFSPQPNVIERCWRGLRRRASLKRKAEFRILPSRHAGNPTIHGAPGECGHIDKVRWHPTTTKKLDSSPTGQYPRR